MAEKPAAHAVLDFQSLKRSALPTWLGLIGGSWLGLAWAGLLSMPVGVGFVILGGSIAGIWAVPLWGTVFGLIGVSRSRDSALKSPDITVLPADHRYTVAVHRLCDRLGMEARPMVATMPMLNAYAIGSKPEKSLVVIGLPLLERLEPMEVAAVIGHELGHIANNDMRRMGLARSFQNALVWYLGFSDTVQRFGRWALTWGSELLVLRLSRKREYWADAIGAALTSKEAMIGALRKIHADPAELTTYEARNARLMFRGIARGSILSTHPTLDERVNALQKRKFLDQLPHVSDQSGSTRTTRLDNREDLAY